MSKKIYYITLLFTIVQFSIFAQEITTYTTWQEDYVGWCRHMPEQVLYEQETDTYRKLQEHDSFTKSKLAKIDSMTVYVIKLLAKGDELFTEALESYISLYDMQPLVFGFHNKAYTNLNEAIKLNQEAIAITEQIHKIKTKLLLKVLFRHLQKLWNKIFRNIKHTY
jgi:hypothetical protein